MVVKSWVRNGRNSRKIINVVFISDQKIIETGCHNTVILKGHHKELIEMYDKYEASEVIIL